MSNNSSKNNQTRHSKVNNSNKTNEQTESKTNNNQNANNSQNLNAKNHQQNSNILKPKTSNQTHEKKSTKKQNIITALIIFGLTFLAALLGKILGGKMVEGRINPPLYPPDWVFSVAWAILYVVIAIATYLAFKSCHNKENRKCTMIWYAVHLFFNLFWPLFYFRLDMLIVSTIILLFMVITAIVLTFKYFKINITAGTLFSIYTLWLLYAMYLNLALTLLNVA